MTRNNVSLAVLASIAALVGASGCDVEDTYAGTRSASRDGCVSDPTDPVLGDALPYQLAFHCTNTGSDEDPEYTNCEVLARRAGGVVLDMAQARDLGFLGYDTALDVYEGGRADRRLVASFAPHFGGEASFPFEGRRQESNISVFDVSALEPGRAYAFVRHGDSGGRSIQLNAFIDDGQGVPSRPFEDLETHGLCSYL